ncbi:glycoside hydrolase family 3 protein [Treponema vincentii]|uniref:glycoside hydrolase family 3 protein n=1 Tax=Treponema vincentii TaxID=69710 RepID=UPI003D8D23A7
MNSTGLTEYIGQMFACGFPGTEMPEDFIALVKKYKVGNVILFKHNIKSLAQLKALCADIQALITAETGHSAFITIDQEGGAVSRLAEDYYNVPGAMALAATGDERNAYTAGKITGEILRAHGVNFDLAPVLDVNSNPKNPVIGVRSYGDNPALVGRYGIQMIRGLTAGGVLSAAKHFPGHGDTSVDSHLTLPTVRKSKAELEQTEIAPFAAAIKTGLLPAVTISHILFPAIDEQFPATISKKIVTGLLKEELGFNGLVISDCMEMKAMQTFFGTEESAAAAINAGIELIFISHTIPTACAAIETVTRACAENRIPLATVEQAARKIIALKKQLTPAQPLPEETMSEYRKVIAGLRRKTLTGYHLPESGFPNLGGKPFFTGPQPFIVTNVSNDVDNSISFAHSMQTAFGGTGIDTSIDPGEAEIARIVAQAESATGIAAASYNGHVKQGQLKLIQALARLHKPMIAVALRNPYDLGSLPAHVCGLAAYEYSNAVLSCIADMLKTNEKPTGKFSVAIPQIAL